MWVYENVYSIRLKLKHRMQSLQKLSLVNMVALTGSWALHCVI